MLTTEAFARLSQRIKQEESFVPESFWDDAPGGEEGQWTWGYGTRAPGPNRTITESEAALLLEVELQGAVREYERLFRGCPQTINDVRRECLIDMIYNLGLVRFHKFHKMLRELWDADPDDWSAVAAEAKNSLWFKQTGNRAKRIERELRLGLRGV